MIEVHGLLVKKACGRIEFAPCLNVYEIFFEENLFYFY